MNYNLTLLKQLYQMLSKTLLYVMVFVTFLTIYQGTIVYVPFLAGIPCILLLHMIMERYCYQPVLYVLLHGVIWIPVCLLPFPVSTFRYLYIFLLILEDIHALVVWKYNTEPPYTEAPWYIYAFAALIYCVARYTGHMQLADWVYWIGLLLLFLHFLRYFTEGSSSFLRQAELVTTIPTRRIMLTNSGLLLLLFLVLGICIACSRLLHFDQFLYAAADLIRRFCRMLLKAILYLIAFLRMVVSDHTDASATADSRDAFEASVQQLTEPSLLARIFMGFLTLAVILFLVILVIRCILGLIRLFLKRYVTDADIIVSLHAEKTAPTLAPQKQHFHPLREWFATNNREKIRKAYRMKIDHYSEPVAGIGDTPSDIAHTVQTMYDESIEELTAVYEKARYSREEITSEDVQKGGLL